MINGELIVDNFAGDVCGRTDTKYADQGGAERSA